MYEQFFGLRERPFELTANPRYLFLTTRHREALSNLVYGLSGRKGITVLTGEAGTGKTTLLSAALIQWRAEGHLVATLRNPTMDRKEFQEFLARDFGLSKEAAKSKATLLAEMEHLLRTRHAEGLLTALVIDEAHSLPIDLLEEIRLLANIETAETKLLPLILLGQPELADRLNDPALRQLKQRVALRCSLVPLDLRETAAYVAKRIRLAGGDSLRLFTREAIEAIHEGAGGIPRLVNVICDNALVNGMAAGHQPVGQDTVREVCLDFDLPVRPLPAAPPARGDGPGPRVAPRVAVPIASAGPPASVRAVAQAPTPATYAPVARRTAPPAPTGGLLSQTRTIPVHPLSLPEPEAPPTRSWLSQWLRWPVSLFRS